MVTILALAGLILLYLEFFLPGAIMAVGGSLLLLASLAHFYLQAADLFSFIVYFIALSAAAFLTIRLGLWRVAKKKIEEDLASVYPEEMIGKSALASSDLAPSGFVLIDNRTFSAKSDAGLIEKGSVVRIVGGEGASFIVTPEIDGGIAQ